VAELHIWGFRVIGVVVELRRDITVLVRSHLSSCDINPVDLVNLSTSILLPVTQLTLSTLYPWLALRLFLTPHQS
jgi:hypothetical protein